MTNATPTKALIREAGELNIYERVFLHTIDSHQNRTMYASVQTCCRHMSMSRAQFYRTRDSLAEKGLIEVEERGSQTTIYGLSRDGLSAIRVPDEDDKGVSGGDTEASGGSLSETGVSLGDNTGVSDRDRGVSVGEREAQQKYNLKYNEKTVRPSIKKKTRKVRPPATKAETASQDPSSIDHLDWESVGLTLQGAQVRGLKPIDFQNFASMV